MAHSFEYAVLRVVPDPRRGECVNIGLAVFLADGVDVRVLPSLAKVTALNGDVDVSSLRELPRVVQEATSGLRDTSSRHLMLRNLGVVSVTELGVFDLGAQDYERVVDRLMKKLVTPVPATRISIPASTRITTNLKSKFRAHKILGIAETDIAKHLVVPNYPIDAEEGLYADFVVKNGAYHVTETADMRAGSASNIDRTKIASLTAIKLHKAKENFGKRTKRFVVYAAKSSGGVQQQINLMGDYSEYIFNLHSKSEMAEYMEHIMAAASATHSAVVPLERPRAKRN
jgi:hypothetical protein